MIQPSDFLRILFETFDKSAVTDFKNFLATNPNVRKWQIAADYCLHDADRPNNSFAFSVIPYDAHFEKLKSEINEALPRDLKKTKIITDEAAAFLTEARRFHFGFVLQDLPKVFVNSPDSIPLVVARESVTATLDALVNVGRQDEKLRRLRQLKQKAQANSFNVDLLGDMYLLSYFFCFVTLALARERPAEIIGWFSDRDSMTTWCDGVLWDISAESLVGLSEHMNIALPPGTPRIALPSTEAGEHAMWYDEYIRLPDYIAGILAAWDFKSNEIPGDKEKYRHLAQNVMKGAKNMAIINVVYGDTARCGRLVFGEESSGG